MRRACLVGAIAASSLVVGVATSSAKGHHHSPKPAPPAAPTFKGTCKFSMSLAVPSGESSVLADATNGTMYGASKCGGAKGVVSFPFAVASSGDIVGKMTIFGPSGSVTGKVDMSESTSQMPTPYAFGNGDFSGTFKITGGTGSYKGVSGNGTLACVTPDSIHYSCTLKVKS